VRRLLIALLLLSSLTAVVEGALPCDVVSVAPQCYVALRPGPTRDVLELIEITDEPTSESAGQLVLTTVSVQSDLTLGELFRLRDDPTSQRAVRSVYFPEDVDDDVTRDQFAAMMTESEQAATVAALRQLGYELDATGVRVDSLMPDGPADGVVEPGEVIVGFDGVEVTDFDSLLTPLGGRSPGETVSLTVETADSEVEERTIELGANPDDSTKAFLGLFLVTRVDIPIDVEIDAGTIGGPSAGLLFALTIVDLLTDEDLTGGMIVAGTGEINLDGRVGPIGGIQQKIPGALDRGDDAPPAEVFLVPRGNVEEARGAAVDRPLLLIPVDTLNDAVDALAVLRDGGTPDGAFELAPMTATATP
jgi:PDZ domain-containing protein